VGGLGTSVESESNFSNYCQVAGGHILFAVFVACPSSAVAPLAFAAGPVTTFLDFFVVRGESLLLGGLFADGDSGSLADSSRRIAKTAVRGEHCKV
jgi:hypothetical protein